MTRALLVVGILVAMLVVPIWLRKGDDAPAAKAQKAEAAANQSDVGKGASAAPVATPAAAATRPIGYGLTFAVAAPEAAPAGTYTKGPGSAQAGVSTGAGASLPALRASAR